MVSTHLTNSSNYYDKFQLFIIDEASHFKKIFIKLCLSESCKSQRSGTQQWAGIGNFLPLF